MKELNEIQLQLCKQKVRPWWSPRHTDVFERETRHSDRGLTSLGTVFKIFVRRKSVMFFDQTIVLISKGTEFWFVMIQCGLHGTKLNTQMVTVETPLIWLLSQTSNLGCQARNLGEISSLLAAVSHPFLRTKSQNPGMIRRRLWMLIYPQQAAPKPSSP